MPSVGALEGAGFADKRASDDASDAPLVRVPPGDAADLVKALPGDDVFVRRDLQHRVRRSVEDGISGAHMFRAQFLENGRAALRIVPQEMNARFLLDPLDQFGGKCGECTKR